MLELHYPTVTKTILERQYPGKPTLKVAFGNDTGAIFENSSKLSASLFVTSRWPRLSGQTNYQVHPPHPPHPPDWVPTNGFVTFLQVRWPLHALTRNLRWNVCNEIQAADIQSTWRAAEAEFIIINRNNIKLFHFTISGDRNIIFFKLIFHVFVWIPLQFRQMNAFTRQHFQDSTLPSRW